MHTPVLSDEPSDSCALGREALCSDLHSRLICCTPPQTFGVFGDWGSGKTSFLRHVQTSLETEKGHLNYVIWFEAWRYQDEPSPIVALLHEIREQLTWKKHFLARLRDTAGKAAHVTIQGALLSLEDLTGKIAGFKASKIQEAGERYERDRLQTPLPTKVIREQLDLALKTLLGAEERSRLVIIIDDLDRCHPTAALRLLDGIKIYLNISKCVFVLGLNPREVQRAIETQVPTADDADHRAARAAEYLEKICGYAVRLPYLHAERQAEIVKKWLTGASGLAFPAHVAKGFAETVQRSGCLPANPRKMKAWCNSLLQLIARKFPLVSLASAELNGGDKTEARKAAQWNAVLVEKEFATLTACLYTFHPELHRRLNRNPSLFKTVLQWAAHPSPHSSHTALTSRALSESTAEKDIPLNDLSRLQPTHFREELKREDIEKLSGTEQYLANLRRNQWTDEDWDKHRLLFDPSLPSVFYCQRLLVELCSGDEISATLTEWLKL